MSRIISWLRPDRRRPASPHRRRVRAAVVAAFVVVAVPLTTAGACSNSSAPTATNNQTVQNNIAGTVAQEFSAAVPYPFASCTTSGCTTHPPSDPLERKNLAFRLQEYNSAGSTNYVYIFPFGGGQPIGYYVISGKVSSTGSQMTSTDVNVTCNGSSSCTNAAPDDDGTYGADEGGQFGVFFRTSNNTLVETDMPFVVSNHPLAIWASLPQLQK